MKVLFITRKYPPRIGGMENLSYHITTVIRCDKKIIALRRRQYHLVWFVPYAILVSLLYAPKYDLIHLGDPVLSMVGMVLKLIWRKPVAVTVHGLDLTYKNPIYKLYFKFFAKKLDKYICISRFTEKQAQKKGLSPTVVVPAGVDSAYFGIERSKSNLEKYLNLDLKGRFVLLTAGRLVKRKGADWFIRNVLSQLSRKYLYLVVGQGKDKERIVGSVKKHDLQDQVKVLGRVGDRALKDIYSGSDLFVMPNIKVAGDQEGFGIVAIEAAAAGLPVVAAGIEGITEAIIDQQNGFLLQSGVANDWIDKIESLAGNSDFRLEFAEKAREFTKNGFSWESITDKYLSEFKTLL